MEASAQGHGESGQPAESGPDVSQLAEQLGQLSAGQEELRNFLQSQPWQQQEAPDPEPESDPMDLSFLDPADPSFDPEALAERLGGLVEQTAERRAQALLQQHVDPLRNDVAEMRRQAESDRLVAEFPELAEEGTAEQVVSLSRQIAEAQGRPELADEPWFWRMTYMAGRAAEAANGEGAEPPAAHLEGGGGAVPASSGADLGDLIVSGGEGAPRGRRALPF